MQLEVQVGTYRYRLHEANNMIVGIAVEVVEKFGQRSPVTYWRPGRCVPLGRCLLPVVAAARARLPLTIADPTATALIEWLAKTGRASVPSDGPALATVAVAILRLAQRLGGCLLLSA
jgi:hypothetical protein